jgi:anti-sigma regulatory factor (Ser/Thr protein kinase)
VIERLDAFARGVEAASFSTVTYAVLDPALGRLRYACAGHPPPILRTDGDAELLMGGRSAPLAASSSIARREAELMLRGEASLLLYSDGLFERRGEPLDVGLERLREAVARLAAVDPERFCDELIEEMLAGKPAADDVALLLVQPLGRWGSCLVRRFPARPEELARLRQAAGAWLAAAGVSGEVGKDALLAVDEAAANAVEHAYLAGDGDVEIELREDEGDLVVAVRDFGRWRDPPAPGERGHGTRIMRHFAHELEFERRGNGTTVRMRRHLSPGAPATAPGRARPARRAGG